MKEELEETLQKAHKAKSEDNYWNQITKLRTFVNEKTISRCFELIESDDIKFKQIGIDVLCQLGQDRKSFIKELIEKTFTILENSTDEKLVYTCFFALGHNNKYLKVKHIKALEKFQISKSKDIRYALAFSLCGIENSLAIKILIKLAQDRSPKVKDWATFGLGSLIEVDNEDIRNILYKNCFSKDSATRHEARMGLDNRNDERVRALILQEIQSENFDSFLFDTILKIKNGEEYLPKLVEIYNRSKDDKNIDEEWISELKNFIEILQS